MNSLSADNHRYGPKLAMDDANYILAKTELNKKTARETIQRVYKTLSKWLAGEEYSNQHANEHSSRSNCEDPCRSNLQCL